MKGILLGSSRHTLNCVWSPERRLRLAEWVDLAPEPVTPADLVSTNGNLGDVEVVFSTWGMPTLRHEELDCLPNLKAVFYAAGTVKAFAGPLLERGIIVVSAAAANAVPVAEFTLSQILFSLKAGWQHDRQRLALCGPAGWKERRITGAYGATVGIISLGMVGRKLCELLRPFNLHKLAYDPIAEDIVFASENLERAGLDRIFREADVVSLHAPWLPQTEGMITGELLRSMKQDATFVNTARGALVREQEMIAVLRERPDLTAILDVTVCEPPEADSNLYTLPNAVLFPHIAGSKGNELARMADFVTEEFIAWRNGEPLGASVTGDLLPQLA